MILLVSVVNYVESKYVYRFASAVARFMSGLIDDVVAKRGGSVQHPKMEGERGTEKAVMCMQLQLHLTPVKSAYPPTA